MSHHLKPFDPVRDVEDLLRELRHAGQWRTGVPAIRPDIH